MKIELGQIMYDALFGEENKSKIIQYLNDVINIPILFQLSQKTS